MGFLYFIASMLRKTQSNLYLLAFNAKAKARPNFGLPGVGYWSSNTYHQASHNAWGFVVVVFPYAAFWLLSTSGVVAVRSTSRRSRWASTCTLTSRGSSGSASVKASRPVRRSTRRRLARTKCRTTKQQRGGSAQRGIVGVR